MSLLFIFLVLIFNSDIHPKNILLGIDDPRVLADFEEEERDFPSPRKMVDDRVIHISRKLDIHGSAGRPVLCDFGEARIGEGNDNIIQPHLYRAPEVILEISWNNKVDIWMVGVMVSHLHLYTLKSSKHELDHLHFSVIPSQTKLNIKFLHRSGICLKTSTCSPLEMRTGRAQAFTTLRK